MGRKSSMWPRKGRGWATVIHGVTYSLGKDKKKAEKEFYRLLAQNVPSQPGKHSLPQLVGIYLDHCEAMVAEGTMRQATYDNYNTRLTPWSQTHRLVKPDDLRVFHLTQYLAAHKNWNSTTKCIAARIIKRWSRFVAMQGYVEVDRLGLAQPPTPRRRAAVDGADLLRFGESIAEPCFSDWFWVLYDTGARPGELTGLEVQHVDLKGSSAIVAGKSGERVVGLSPRAVAILRRCALAHPDGPLLRTPMGKPWSRENYRKHFRVHRTAMGLPKLVPYSCRHDLAPRWRAAGVQELVIARQLGHSLRGVPHLGLLASTYGHVHGAELADAARQASSSPAKKAKKG